MLKISDFSRLGQVSARALRHYDEIRLLQPARVDPFTGYRYYSLDQLPRLRCILALKDLGLSLEQIAQVLDEDFSPDRFWGMLRLKQAELEGQMQDVQAQLGRVKGWLKQVETEDEMPGHDAILRTVELQQVASQQPQAEEGERVGLSQSAKESGWISYPAQVWDEERPPDLVHDLPFWQYCAEKYGDPILDVCCGNGRIAIPLAKLGYEVVGVDVNPGFIASAQRRVEEVADTGHPLKVSFRVGDIVRLSLERTFRLAIMPDWAFQVLLTQEDQLSFLRALREHLMPEGAFAFTLFVPFGRQQGLIERNDKYQWPPDPSYHSGTPRTYDPVSQIETLAKPNIHPIKIRHTNLAELRLLLWQTGFEIAELYGDVDRRPFTGTSDDDYTAVARRGEGEPRL